MHILGLRNKVVQVPPAIQQQRAELARVQKSDNKVRGSAPNEQVSQPLEITVVVILNFSNTPEVFAALDSTAVRSLDILV